MSGHCREEDQGHSLYCPYFAKIWHRARPSTLLFYDRQCDQQSVICWVKRCQIYLAQLNFLVWNQSRATFWLCVFFFTVVLYLVTSSVGGSAHCGHQRIGHSREANGSLFSAYSILFGLFQGKCGEIQILEESEFHHGRSQQGD